MEQEALAATRAMLKAEAPSAAPAATTAAAPSTFVSGGGTAGLFARTFAVAPELGASGMQTESREWQPLPAVRETYFDQLCAQRNR